MFAMVKKPKFGGDINDHFFLQMIKLGEEVKM